MLIRLQIGDYMQSQDVIRYMVDTCGKSQREISRDLGKSDTYIGSSLAQGSKPTLDLVARVARATGYRLILEDADGNRFPIDAD